MNSESDGGYKFAVVGLGLAGCLFLANLPPETLTPQILAIESSCIGGDLARLYGNVLANLTRTELEAAFRKTPCWTTVSEFAFFKPYSPDKCPLLADLCRQLRELMKPILTKITVKFTTVTHIQKGDVWCVGTKSGNFTAKKVILCTGADPKQMDLPKSVIPLEIALHQQNLARFIQSEDRIVVFGTAHSGTLILRNLKDCGCRFVSAVYRGEKPFRWKRDGDPEGIKQESATIADEIVGKCWGPLQPKLIPLSDTATMIRAVMEAEHIIYAIGFSSRQPCVEGVELQSNSETGKLAEGMWGFGIGFPSFYMSPSGTKAPDVGVAQFAEHIQKCIPAILEC